MRSIHAGLAARYDFAKHFYQHHFTVTVGFGQLLRGTASFWFGSAYAANRSIQSSSSIFPDITRFAGES
jgi:hypothetical protein